MAHFRPLLTLFLLLALRCQAQTAMTDGPYVFYNGDQAVVRRIGQTTADSTSFSIADKPQQLLAVHLDGHPEWDFTVKLKRGNSPRGCVFAGASKTLVLSDIEGEFEPFRNLLLAAKVIDGQYNWTFGSGKLVVAGDLFDRGKQVCQFLWLLYKLEDEARAKGGDVHVVLGNHDIMNLQGDFRYVQPEYNTNAQLMGQTYASLYGANTELGQWLRSKNIIEKIGGLLVLHGGVSPELLARHLSLVAINNETRPYFARPFREIPDSLKDLFNEQALFWYRGYFLEPRASQGMIDSTLAFYGCKKIVVGHDIIDQVAAFYNHEVIGVDVDEHQQAHEALLIDQGKYYRLDDKGNKELLIN